MNTKHPSPISAAQVYDIGPIVSDEVIEWLDAHAKKRLIQLPIEITLTSTGGIENSFLSGEKTKISIRLDDSAMGIALAMQIKSYCKSKTCRVFLEGTWGPSIEQKEKVLTPTFTIHKIIGTADPQDLNVRLLK